MNSQAMASYSIQHWGSEAQKKQYVPALIKGETIGAFAIYERGPTPGIGPDALVATKNDGYVLKGTKAYVRKPEKGVYVVFAVTDPTEPQAPTAFVVDEG